MREEPQIENEPSEEIDPSDVSLLSFDKACDDCFNALPEDLCPRPASHSNSGTRSTGERLLFSLGQLSQKSEKIALPLSGTISDVFEHIEKPNREKPEESWSIPSKVTREIAPNHSLRLPSSVEEQPFLVKSIPPLDNDSQRLKLTRPTNFRCSTSYLERWDLRQRQQIGLASNADLFAASLIKLVNDPEPSHEALKRLAFQVGRSTVSL
jgi:hypothetical protein